MTQTALALKKPPLREHAHALPAGTMLMEYRLEQVLGAGGFGITYLGWDTHLEKHVAIKEYLPAQLAVRALDGSIVPIATEQKYDYVWGLERFVLEARTLARFSHPHIVRVNRYIEANATAYMVMDYEAGVPLTQWLADHAHPAEAVLQAIVAPILEGLDAVHAQGFLHRDIKPSNLFMRENGSPVLIDFGAARQAIGHRSVSLTSIVSPGYAPLEQYATDGNQGPWTDVYSLSAVLFRAVTGENPPEAVSRMRIDRVQARLDAAAGRYSSGFLKAIALGMTLDEKLRPQSVREWREVLGASQSAQGGEAVQERPSNAATSLKPPGSTGDPSRSRGSVVQTRRARAVAADGRARRWRWIAFATATIVAAGYFARESARARAPAPQTVAATPVQHAAPALPDPVVSAANTPTIEPVQEHVPERRESTAAVASPPAFSALPLAPAEPAPPAMDTAKADALPQPARRPQPAPLKGLPGLMRDFERADANGDGAITLAEAREGMPRLARDFERVDANGDGRVTPIELQRFLRPGPERGPRP